MMTIKIIIDERARALSYNKNNNNILRINQAIENARLSSHYIQYYVEAAREICTISSMLTSHNRIAWSARAK